MSKTCVVYTCAHAEPGISNKRADWLGALLFDLRPNYVVNLGDAADMRSLNTFDSKYPEKIIEAQSYEKDIEAYLDFEERVRYRFKKSKKKMPDFFGFEGNHEHRIARAISEDPRLRGKNYGVDESHLDVGRLFTEYYWYENSAPAIQCIDGVDYAHFISSGNYGQAMSGEYHSANLLKKRMRSTTVGHSHKRSLAFRDDANAIGLVAGCFKGGAEDWAGQANDEWWSGIIIKHNIQDGLYDPEFVSLSRLEKEYG